jgi:hypothetical protein
MKQLPNRYVYAILAILLTTFWSCMILLGIRFAPTERKVDCSIAEFHPDITPKEREQCRLIRSGGKLV